MRSPRHAAAALVAALGLGACQPQGPTVAATAGEDGRPRGPIADPQEWTPRLVVLVVVDQMRADFITRWRPRWSRGLARLVDEGAVWTDVRHDHAGTFTAAGHATLSTGVYPARHGFIANRLWDRATWSARDVVGDPSVRPLGPAGALPLSPHLRLREGLADWVRARAPRAHVVSVGLKDRAVIALGGMHPEAAVWIDRNTGQVASSTYFGERLPDWALGYDAATRAEELLSEGWARLAEAEGYPGEDAVAAEADGVHTTFPHERAGLLAMDGDVRAAVRYTPFGNVIVRELAEAALADSELGQDGIPDLLFVAFSSTDYVGHRYGPDSHEVFDTYLRLDRQVGILLDTLDARVGRGRYVVVLTSDHGVTPLPESVGGQRIRPKQVEDVARRAAKATLRSLGRRWSGRVQWADGVFVDLPRDLPPAEAAKVRAHVAESLREQPWVADAFTLDELTGPTVPDRPYARAFAHSAAPGRAPDVFVLPPRGSLIMDYPGTTHGTPYDSDTRVPLVVFGTEVTPGSRGGAVTTVQIAPTVAELLQVPPPEDLDGTPLRVLGTP